MPKRSVVQLRGRSNECCRSRACWTNRNSASWLIEHEIDTVLVVFTDLYGRFMGKRFDAHFFLETVMGHGSHACDYLLTVDMEMEPVPGYEFANWETGYGDVHLVPDMQTMRRATWLEKTALVICDVQRGVDHAAVSQAPRSILRGPVAAGERSGADRHGRFGTRVLPVS